MVLNKKSRKESTLKKILKVPLRVLARAMDFYMKGMAEYSDQVCVMSCPTGNFNNMPRSYSVSSTNPNHLDDDHRDLLRAASTRSNLGSRNKKIIVDVPARQQYSHTKSATRVGDNMRRSHSVPPIGRIDEETPCDFDEEDVKVKSSVCPRSRSYAVSKRKLVSNFHKFLNSYSSCRRLSRTKLEKFCLKILTPIRFLFFDLKFYMEIVKRISVKSKRLILCPKLGDAPRRRSSSDTAGGLAFSCYGSVWISQAASVGFFRGSSLTFRVVLAPRILETQTQHYAATPYKLQMKGKPNKQPLFL
ncbi:hypothetical protein DKX38_020406 [Salix brachista]|uniref:Uncharacterized protein n=1 Tax=Salix brachista TaxID=2182728 RepID=A0A5N5K594_9ROSI|nr:hypothetical protein DKX38_020406 [Salix brachista]